MDKHREDIKKYGMLHEYHDSEQFLVKNPHLACEHTANYLVIWCIDLQVEEVWHVTKIFFLQRLSFQWK